jgi:hypothetical protein
MSYTNCRCPCGKMLWHFGEAYMGIGRSCPACGRRIAWVTCRKKRHMKGGQG